MTIGLELRLMLAVSHFTECNRLIVLIDYTTFQVVTRERGGKEDRERERELERD